MPEAIAKLSFWGVRGSTPTVDRATWRYGGNTPCLELETPSGARFILDCGTGLRTLGKHWNANRGGRETNAHIFLTHYHWDHIQGIPFFRRSTRERIAFTFTVFGRHRWGRTV